MRARRGDGGAARAGERGHEVLLAIAVESEKTPYHQFQFAELERRGVAKYINMLVQGMGMNSQRAFWIASTEAGRWSRVGLHWDDQRGPHWDDWCDVHCHYDYDKVDSDEEWVSEEPWSDSEDGTESEPEL